MASERGEWCTIKRVEGIRAVTYDCWSTLLKDKDYEGAMATRAGALRRFLDLSEAEADDLLAEAWSRHDEAWKQVETFGPGRMAAYCLEARGIDDDESIQNLTKEFEEASIEAGVGAVEHADETLAALSAANIRLGLVCDTGFTPGRVVRQLLEDAGLCDYLEALAELGARPPEAIHVGDLKRTDIAGAHDMGMHAARFKGVHDDKSDFLEAEVVISDHRQLLEVVGLG